MCISASDLIFAKSVMSTRIKYQKGGVCLPFDVSVRKTGLEQIICGADGRRWRGLDRAKHKFNRVLLLHQERGGLASSFYVGYLDMSAAENENFFQMLTAQCYAAGPVLRFLP